ncbi:hypothetical protein JHK85_001821 [Glycine max]|nr:hypothetical protein JHK85_001821 [Glycine max]KAG5089160.1 hypothetical protein JHK86_001772 [Glycine max]
MDLDLRKSGHGIGSNASLQSNLVLYSYCHSSCSWRIRFALSLKALSPITVLHDSEQYWLRQKIPVKDINGIPYEYKAVDLSKGEQYSPEFERLNPLHYVPVLVDDNVVVSDSYAIFLHLEEKYTQKPLLPVDPQLRALNLQVASIIHSSIQPLHMLNVLKDMEKMFCAESKPWAQFTIDKGFSALEKLLKDFAGTYATGEHIYMADVFLAPQITLAVQRFDIDMSKFPTLSRLYETYKALPEFQASSPQRQPDALIHNP